MGLSDGQWLTIISDMQKVSKHLNFFYILVCKSLFFTSQSDHWHYNFFCICAYIVYVCRGCCLLSKRHFHELSIDGVLDTSMQIGAKNGEALNWRRSFGPMYGAPMKKNSRKI